MKKIILGILVTCFLVSVCIHVYPLARFSSGVPATPITTNIFLFEQPEAGKRPIVESIQTAHREVLVEMYLLTDDDVLRALESAAKRGVVVRIMLEEHPFQAHGLNQKTMTRLQADHIATQWTNSSFTYSHQKVMVIDREKLFVLNQNLTAAAFEKNREYDVVDTNIDDVQEVIGIFEADWAKKTYWLHPTHLLVSPQNSRTILTKNLEAAKQSISIETEVIGDPQLEAVLTTQAQKIPVRVLVPDFEQLPANQAVVRRLQKQGVQVKTLSSPYIHAKLLLVDQELAYIGSINFTTQSLDENREVGLLVGEAGSLSQLNKSFEQDWQLAHLVK